MSDHDDGSVFSQSQMFDAASRAERGDSDDFKAIVSEAKRLQAITIFFDGSNDNPTWVALAGFICSSLQAGRGGPLAIALDAGLPGHFYGPLGGPAMAYVLKQKKLAWPYDRIDLLDKLMDCGADPLAKVTGEEVNVMRHVHTVLLARWFISRGVSINEFTHLNRATELTDWLVFGPAPMSTLLKQLDPNWGRAHPTRHDNTVLHELAKICPGEGEPGEKKVLNLIRDAIAAGADRTAMNFDNANAYSMTSNRAAGAMLYPPSARRRPKTSRAGAAC